MRGEVCSSSAIEQLLAAGITDITVVVGYKKEYFFSSRRQVCVSIVVNPDYASRNNSSSIKRVEDRLGNTYICSSDDYFTENLEPYVWEGLLRRGISPIPTPSGAFKPASRPHHRRDTGGENAWYMIGHVYFDHAFSETYVPLLTSSMTTPTPKMLGTHLPDNIKKADMVARRYPAGTIFEFDSLDECASLIPNPKPTQRSSTTS